MLVEGTCELFLDSYKSRYIKIVTVQIFVLVLPGYKHQIIRESPHLFHPKFKWKRKEREMYLHNTVTLLNRNNI